VNRFVNRSIMFFAWALIVVDPNIGLFVILGVQERQGGRMKQSQLGVLREDPHDDVRALIENYTGEL